MAGNLVPPHIRPHDLAERIVTVGGAVVFGQWLQMTYALGITDARRQTILNQCALGALQGGAAGGPLDKFTWTFQEYAAQFGPEATIEKVRACFQQIENMQIYEALEEYDGNMVVSNIPLNLANAYRRMDID